VFTGIITDVGRVRSIERRGDARFEFTTQLDTIDFEIGASIACCGVCLTVVEFGDNWFATEVSLETLSRTTLDLWTIDTPINFERPLRAADELGGHIVSGHVDGIGTVTSIEAESTSKRFCFEADRGILKFVAVKGSIAVNGVSLTVNEVNSKCFGVNIIPHTQAHTNFGTIKVDDRVNLEIDMLARYVSKILEED